MSALIIQTKSHFKSESVILAKKILFNRCAEIPGLKAGDEGERYYPAEYRKNIEEILAISYEAGLLEKPQPLGRGGSFLDTV